MWQVEIRRAVQHSYNIDRDLFWIADSLRAAWISILNYYINRLNYRAVNNIHGTVDRNFLNDLIDVRQALVLSEEVTPALERRFMNVVAESRRRELGLAFVYPAQVIPSEWTNEISWIPLFINLLKKECSLMEELNPWDVRLDRVEGASYEGRLIYRIHVTCWQKPWPDFLDWLAAVGKELGLDPTTWQCHILSDYDIPEEHRFVYDVTSIPWARFRRRKVFPNLSKRPIEIVVEGPQAVLSIVVQNWWNPHKVPTWEHIRPPPPPYVD